MSRLLEASGRIGLLGGTFDPPHWGHIRTAVAAADELQLNQLAFLPSPHPPHKRQQQHTPFVLRRQMVELCLSFDPRFRLCLIEHEMSLPGTTLETVNALRKGGFTEDRCHLIWLIGSDSLLELGSWRRPDDLLQSVEVAVLPRSGYPADRAEERFLRRVRLLQIPRVDISSSDIRSGKRSLTQSVPPPVKEFIRAHQLYGVQ